MKFKAFFDRVEAGGEVDENEISTWLESTRGIIGELDEEEWG